MKPLIVILLAIAVFGSGTYMAWRLYVKPQAALKAEKAGPPASPPPDPTLPEFEKHLAQQESMNLVEARKMWADFIDRYPESSKASQAKDYLGRLNTAIYLAPIESPEKQVYNVKAGDVITRVAQHMKTTPELIMKCNNLQGSMLRIGQKLLIPPSDFAVTINRRAQKVTLTNNGKFFKQYAILAMPQHGKPGQTPGGKVAATPRPPKVLGRVTDRIAWNAANERVTFTDKNFAFADFWIMISPGGHSLYSERPAPPGAPPQAHPQGGGYVMAPEDLREMAALLKKNDQVTID